MSKQENATHMQELKPLQAEHEQADSDTSDKIESIGGFNLNDPALFFNRELRITSYNVCYTKLLR